MTRPLLMLCALAALLAACAAHPPAVSPPAVSPPAVSPRPFPPPAEPPCARPPEDGKDGGLGGTGNAPDLCATPLPRGGTGG